MTSPVQQWSMVSTRKRRPSSFLATWRIFTLCAVIFGICVVTLISILLHHRCVGPHARRDPMCFFQSHGGVGEFTKSGQRENSVQKVEVVRKSTYTLADEVRPFRTKSSLDENVVRGKILAAIDTPVFGYQTLPNDVPIQLDDVDVSMTKKSLQFPGNTQKLARLFYDTLVSGQPLTVASIGGSVSTASGINWKTCHACLYSEAVVDWLRRAFNVQVSLQNAAIGATGSEYYAFCLDNHINVDKVDLILGEFGFNDDRYHYMPGYREQGRPLEELIRHVFSLPSHPVFALVSFMFPKSLFDVRNVLCKSIEDTHFKRLAHHYNVAMVSWKSAVCKAVKRNWPGFSWTDLVAADGNHPNVKSHQMMAHFVVSYFKVVLKQLSFHLGRYDEDILANSQYSLPNKLHYSTWITAPSCWTDVSHQFKPTQPTTILEPARSSGWFRYSVYIDRNRDDYREGYITDAANTFVVFRLNITARPAYLPPGSYCKLAICYTLCKQCQRGEMLAWVGEESAYMQENISLLYLVSYGYKTNIVQQLEGIKIRKDGPVTLTLFVISGNYSVRLHAVMAAWYLPDT